MKTSVHVSPVQLLLPLRFRHPAATCRIVNYTDFDNELVRRIIRFVRPPNISNFKVTLYNSDPDCWCGITSLRKALSCDGSSAARPAKDVSVKIYVPRGAGHAAPFTKPRHWLLGGGYLPAVQFSAEEVLVHLLAHELRHIWQARVPRGRRVWGARGQFSERDADAYAIRRLRAWRTDRMNCTRSATRRDLSMNVAA
jgi:hypothetical protein